MQPFKVLLCSLFITLSCNSCATFPNFKSSQERIFSNLANSVVIVNIEDPFGTSGSMGSGVVIKVTKDGSYILTAAHVVKNIQGLNILNIDFDYKGENLSKSATIVAISKFEDLAILFVANMNELKEVKVAIKDPDLYTNVYLMGAPLEIKKTASIGLLSSKSISDFENETIWQINQGVVIFGISGGPVVNEHGDLIGISKAFRSHPGVVVDAKDRETIIGFTRNLVPDIGYCVGRPAIYSFLKDNKLL